MTALRPGELEAVATAHAGTEAQQLADGTTLITVPRIALPPGWSAKTTCVCFLLPVGYPGARPDCFWADEGLRLASGSMPANAQVQPIPGTAERGLWFSWHLRSWQAADRAASYVRFILRRLADAR